MCIPVCLHKAKFFFIFSRFNQIMDNMNFRNEFIKAVNSREYFIDKLGVFDFPIRNQDIESPQQLSDFLNEISDRIVLDVTLKSIELKYFYNIIAELLVDFCKITINDNSYFLQNNIQVVIEDYNTKYQEGISEVTPLSDLTNGELKVIQDFSRRKYEACEALSNRIAAKLNISSVTTLSKINLNLSVAEIALLFRLMADEGIIEIKNNEEFYRSLTSTFSSKKTPDISPSSFKNKYLSPDGKSISNIDSLLVNLRQRIKKIQ